MVTDREFITQSLELNLFFMRIAKEHSIFMESAFLPKDYNLIQEAEGYKNLFTHLLAKTICLSDGVISPDVASSGELVTDLTLEAERGTEYYSGIFIDKTITRAELSIARTQRDEKHEKHPVLMEQVFALNQEAIAAATALANFKSRLLKNVLSCRVFTFNYPLLLDHILREARFYVKLLRKLQDRSSINTANDFIEQQIFWNRIMAEHSKFIRGLLDPTEVDLFNTAHRFGTEFDALTAKAVALTEQTGQLSQTGKLSQTAQLSEVTRESLDAAKRVRDFKTQGTQGLIECKIKAIAMPLLGDHVVREANHFIRLLKAFY